jgi:hypothetical protein
MTVDCLMNYIENFKEIKKKSSFDDAEAVNKPEGC